ncbi:hypothetical protein [Paraburkholderia sediminicola]|uniref:hypothetical protein n=1 Tax=Paraburkholderia sediminicola TaxID=458836 RepID=UPI0038B7E771
MTHSIKCLDLPEEHDYQAALSYLSLLFDEGRAETLVDMLRAAPVVEFHAKDIARASGLTLLGADIHHVAHNLDKVKAGKELSPLLLVRSDHLCIADEFHRLSAVHLLDEDALIPVKIV